MSLFSQFATNRKAEVEGIEVIFGAANEDGTVPTFRIARMSKNNKRYQRMLELETKPHIYAIRNDNLDPEIDEAITLKIFIATVLLGWKNLQCPELFTEAEHASLTESGQPCVPFTQANADKLFRVLPELYAALKENAQKMSNFRAEEIKADSKN